MQKTGDIRYRRKETSGKEDRKHQYRNPQVQKTGNIRDRRQETPGTGSIRFRRQETSCVENGETS